MIYFMKLKQKPFQMIQKGIKTIEMRLNDEKRQLLQVGDFIEFTNIETNEKIKTQIIQIYSFKNFYDLYFYFEDKTKLGYNENEVALPSDMIQYYKEEDIDKYGVLGIEIKVVSSNV